MKFQVIKTKEAEKEFNELSDGNRNILESDYEIIQTEGIEFVKRRPLGDGLFEIKSNDLRSLFVYQENQIILVGLIYQKDSKKAPTRMIRLAKKRLR